MPAKLLVLLVAVSLAACVDDASSPDETDTATVTDVTAEPATPPSQVPAGATRELSVPGPSLSEMLPTDESNPCSHLCDPDFASYLPPHTCVELACPLTDGTIYRAGGCTP